MAESRSGQPQRPGGGLTPAQLRAVVELWRRAGRRTAIPVVGGSMFPMLVEGAALVVDHRARQHTFGEVIVFLEGSMLVAHRIVGRDASNAYITKGDALLHFDRHPVPAELVVGRVVALRRDGVEVPFAGGWRGLAHPLFGAFSRLIGDLNRAARPLRDWQLSAGGRLPAGLPGPTRVLRRVNRVAVAIAARLISPARRLRARPPGAASTTPRDGSDSPGRGS